MLVRQKPPPGPQLVPDRKLIRERRPDGCCGSDERIGSVPSGARCSLPSVSYSVTSLSASTLATQHLCGVPAIDRTRRVAGIAIAWRNQGRIAVILSAVAREIPAD
jgi:hypothetical protein